VGDADVYPIPGFNDPVSSLTHLIGAGVFAILSIFLLWRGRGSVVRVVSLGVFAFSCVFLLSMSGVYHLLTEGGAGRAVLRRLDHAAIFVFIAGTFTPVLAILCRGLFRWVPLLLIWTAAATAVPLKTIFLNQIPQWLGVSLYLGMGWFGGLVAIDLWRRYGIVFLRDLIFGAGAYTVGALLDFAHWPTLLPGVVGPHEVFHVFVLAGAGFHWSFVARCVGHAVAPGQLSRGEAELGEGREELQWTTTGV
jgi:channel protein (hemolysin III family)